MLLKFHNLAFCNFSSLFCFIAHLTVHDTCKVYYVPLEILILLLLYSTMEYFNSFTSFEIHHLMLKKLFFN